MHNVIVSSGGHRGAPVFDRSGWEFGVFKGVLFDWETKAVKFIVLSIDGFLGVGTDNRPLPIELLSPNADKPGFTADLTADLVASGPSYCDDRLAELTEHFLRCVVRHYERHSTEVRAAGKPSLVLLSQSRNAAH